MYISSIFKRDNNNDQFSQLNLYIVFYTCIGSGSQFEVSETNFTYRSHILIKIILKDIVEP